MTFQIGQINRRYARREAMKKLLRVDSKKSAKDADDSPSSFKCLFQIVVHSLDDFNFNTKENESVSMADALIDL